MPDNSKTVPQPVPEGIVDRMLADAAAAGYAPVSSAQAAAMRDKLTEANALHVQYSATCQDCLQVWELSSDADKPDKAAAELRAGDWFLTERGWLCSRCSADSQQEKEGQQP